jgi:hypothetical protein
MGKLNVCFLALLISSGGTLYYHITRSRRFLTFPSSPSQTIGYPFDIIKTRIQASKKNQIKGMYATAVELVEEANGRVIAGLYRGFGLKLVRAVPASMIGFTTYEFVAGQLRQ